VSGLAQIGKDVGDARDSTARLLADVLRNDLSYGVQGAACDALSKIGGDDALVALRAATDYASPNDRVGAAALRGRLALEDKMAVDEVFAMARGQADAKRKALGLQSLGGLSDSMLSTRREEAVSLLMDAAQNGGGDAQRAAISSLGDLKVVEAEDFLKKLSEKQDGPRFLRFTVRNALQRIDEAKKKAAEALAATPPKPEPTVADLNKTIGDLQKQLEALTQRLQELEKRPVAAPTAPGPAPTTTPAAPTTTPSTTPASAGG
jgi:hypothetical protein